MKEFFKRHSVILAERDLLYPLYKSWENGEIVISLAIGAVSGVISGEPLAGITPIASSLGCTLNKND